MAKKKKGLGASLRQQAIPVVQQKAPRTISTNVSTGGSGLASSFKTATQKAEEERSARMRQGLSSVVRASFNNRRLQQSDNSTNTIKKGLYQNLRNQLAPVKETANYTRSQQSKFLTTDLQRKGMYTPAAQLMAGKTNVGVEQGKALRAGMPTNSNVIESWRRTASDAERNARQKYGYDKDFAQKQITERLDNSGRKEVFDPSNGQITTALPARLNTVAPNEVTYKAGDALRGMRLDDIRAGFADAFARKNVEDTAQRQYGITVDDDTQARLDAQRETLGYGTGMAAGQMTQYALTRGALSGLGLVGRGAKAADTAGKAFRAEMAIDQAASVPLNLIDAMKEDNLEGIVKRFGLNQGLDLVFGAFTEGISIKRNPLYRNAEAKHIAAKEARNAGDNAAANALDNSARRDLGAISNDELDEARNDIVARVGEQRRIINDEQVNAIQNAEGTVGEFPSTDYAYRIGGDRAHYDNMRDDMLGAIESQEAIGAGNVPNNIGMRADVRPYESTRSQLTGIDKVLADYNMSADELIERLQDPSFNDQEMLEAIASDIVPVGRRRGISIDAERQYADNVKNYRQSARSADSILGSNDIIPTKDQITSGNASYGGIPLKYKPGMHAEAENYTTEIWVSNKFFDLSPENQRHVLNHEVAHNYADDLMSKNTGNWNEFADKFIKEKNVPVDSPMYKNGARTYWEGLYGDIGATSLSETVTRAITEYLDNPSALRNRSAEAFDVIDNYMLGRTIPSKGETYRRMLSDSVIDELRRGQTPSVADDVAQSAPVEQTTRAVPADNTARKAAAQSAKNESVEDATERLIKKWGNTGNEASYREIVKQYNGMSAAELKNEKEALQRMANTSSIDPDEAADRIAVIDAISREKNAARATEKTAEVPKAKTEEPKAEAAAKKEVFVSEEQVDKAFNDAIRKRSYRFETLRAYPRAGDMRILYMDDAYDENGFRRLIREDIERANAQKPKSEPNVDRSREAWDNIEGITDKAEKPEDLMRKRPTRNEPAIPKASDQKTRKEVLFRGEEAKGTAEQAAQEAPKRRQVKGILNEEQPKTEYSEMSLHDLQAERHSLEEQVRYDKSGRVEEKILDIDEEFKRRGKEPNWFNVEPEEGGNRVRSPREANAEVERLKKKYGEFKNGLNKKIETDEGVRRNLKTLDTILPEASPEVDHIVTNNMLDGKYAIDDGRTTKDILTEVKANMAENPEAYTNKVVNFDETVDARERIVALETAQAYWKEVGNTEYELKATEALSKYVSESASILKIHGILRKLSKPARMDYLDQTIAKLEKRFEKRLKRAKIEHIRVSDETRKMLKEAKTDEQTKEAWTRASLEIWNQIPASVKEKMDFIRVNAMLLNPKTHIRNFFGNALFLPLREAKNITGTGLEYLAMKAGILDPSNRTKAILPYKEGMDYADGVLKDMGDELRGANRYFEDIANDRPFDVDVFMAGRQNGNPFINGIRKATDKIGNFNAWALEHEDFVFFNGAFREHFGRVMKARKLTVKDLENNPALRNNVIEAATEEALRATYRDESAAARMISKWKNPGENAHIMRKVGGVTLDAILPFTKTPINILRRAIDYSPVGFGKGGYNFFRGWHTGNQKQVVKGLDQLASAIPGSGLALLGWFMAERDGVTGNLGAEKDDQFMRDLGKQKFSIVFHSGTNKEWSYTLDWLAPGCIPFFTGVAAKEWSDDGVDFWEVADAFEKMFEPTMEMSVMQGIKNTLDTFRKNSDGGIMQGLFSVGVNTGLQYVGQFKPTLVSQTARLIDPVRRDTTSTADTALQRQIERWGKKQMAGIPGLSQKLNPYQNVWGEEESNTYSDNAAMRVIENYLSPGYAKKYKADDVDKELLNVYKSSSDERSLPSKYSKYSISFDGSEVRFSPEDLSNFNKVSGKVSKQDLRKLFDSSDYKEASSVDKVKMIADVYADAKVEAKHDTLLKMGKDEWKVYTDEMSGKKKPDYADAKDSGLKAEQYYNYMTTKDWDLDESGKPVKSELMLYLNEQDLTDAQRSVIFGKLSNAKNPYEDGTAHSTDWQAEFDSYLANKDKESSGSNKSKGGSRRRRSGGGSGSKKARAKTDSEKRFSNLQKMKAPTTGKGIEALSQGAKGLTKAQKKALIKLLQKKLDV